MKIGTIGTFQVSSPYSVTIDPIVEYKIEAIRSLVEIVDSGSNILKVVYLDHGRAEDDMVADLNTGGVNIFVLSDSSGSYNYIPSYAIVGNPNTEGIPVQERALAVNLGLIASDKTLDDIKQDLSDFILSRLGITTQTQEIFTSAVIRLTTQQYTQLVNTRESLKSGVSSYKSRYDQCVESKHLLIEQNNRLDCMVSSVLGGSVVNAAVLNKMAVNPNLVLGQYTKAVDSDIVFIGSLGCELSINEYVVYDARGFLRIINIHNNSISTTKQVTMSVTTTKHALYAFDNHIIHCYISDKIYCDLYTKDLVLLHSMAMTDGLHQTPHFPSQSKTNQLVVGYSDGGTTKAVYLEVVNDQLTLKITDLSWYQSVSGDTVSITLGGTIGTLRDTGTDIPLVIDLVTGVLTKGDRDPGDTLKSYSYSMSVPTLTDGVSMHLDHHLGTTNIGYTQSPHSGGSVIDTGMLSANTTTIITRDRSLLFIESTDTNLTKIKKAV